MDKEDLIEIGTVVAPQGLKGDIRIKTDSDFPERFQTSGTRWLQMQSHQSPLEVELVKGRRLPGKNIFIVKLAGVEDRNQAESLRGAKLFASKNDRPQLEAEEYHVADLIGIEVFDQQTQENIGIVCDVFTAGNDILEVKLHKQPEPEGGETPATPEKDISKVTRVSKKRKIKRQNKKKKKAVTVLIPFVKEIVPVVNLQTKTIEIIPPRGLINTDQAEICEPSDED